MCFDAVAAFGHAPETELIFRGSRRAQSNCGSARTVAMPEGRRKGARTWQDHFVVARLPRIFLAESEVPDNFYSSDFQAALNLHVDDGA